MTFLLLARAGTAAMVLLHATWLLLPRLLLLLSFSAAAKQEVEDLAEEVVVGTLGGRLTGDEGDLSVTHLLANGKSPADCDFRGCSISTLWYCIGCQNLAFSNEADLDAGKGPLT